MEELRKLIMESYVIPNKEIDNDFYLKILNIMGRKLNLQEVVKRLSFERYHFGRNGQRSEGLMAGFVPAEKMIHIYKDEIKVQTDDIIRKCPAEVTEKERKCLKYIIAAQTFIHEIIHAQQEYFYKNLNSEDYTKERSKILCKTEPRSRENFSYLFEKNMSAFRAISERDVIKEETDRMIERTTRYMFDNYGCFIMKERDAQDQSFSILRAMLEKYGDEYAHVKEYLKANNEYFWLMGYEIVNRRIQSPTYDILNFMLKNDYTVRTGIEWMGDNAEITERNAIQKFPDPTTRARLGLPITTREHAELAKRCNNAITKGYISKLFYMPKKENQDIDL